LVKWRRIRDEPKSEKILEPMMVKDHTAAADELKSIARQKKCNAA
jgi:hypothetical protein